MNIFNCDNGRIANNEFTSQDIGLNMFYSNNNVITNNTFTNKNPVLMKSCVGSIIYDNIINGYNTSCNDDGSDLWYSNGVGNYWSKLELPDDDRDGTSDVVVKVPGGANEDRYALVPNVTFSVKPLSDKGTTGDTLTLNVTASPTVRNRLSSLDLFYGRPSIGYNKSELAPMTNQFTDIDVPGDSIAPLKVHLNAVDRFGRMCMSDEFSIEVADNDKPEISWEGYASEIGNGEQVELRVNVSDNIGLREVVGRVSFMGTPEEHPMVNVGNDTWSMVLDADVFNVSVYNITVRAVDTSFNIAVSNPILIRVKDTVKPSLIEDLTPSGAGTGQRLLFKVKAYDNEAITYACAEYSQGDDDETLNMTDDGESYSANVTLRADSLEPIAYEIVLRDAAGNELRTGSRTITVYDDIPPEIEVASYPDEVGTGENIHLDFSITDNIEEYGQYIEVRMYDSMILNESGVDEVDITIPVDIIGRMYFVIVAEDMEGNVGTYTSTNITVKDIIAPEIHLEGDVEFKVGDNTDIRVNASDNIKVGSIVWECNGVEGSGERIDVKLEEAGEFVLSVAVTDSSGNRKELNVNITVSEKDDGPGLVLFIVGAFLILFAVLVLCFLFFMFFKRRKEEGKEEAPPSEEGPIAPEQEQISPEAIPQEPPLTSPEEGQLPEESAITEEPQQIETEPPEI